MLTNRSTVRVDEEADGAWIDAPDRGEYLSPIWRYWESTMKIPSGPASTPIRPPAPSGCRNGNARIYRWSETTTPPLITSFVFNRFQ
jgi:hypothetical protein